MVRLAGVEGGPVVPALKITPSIPLKPTLDMSVAATEPLRPSAPTWRLPWALVTAKAPPSRLKVTLVSDSSRPCTSSEKLKLPVTGGGFRW